MPRRSTRQPDPEASEKRVTRRSLQRAAKTNAAPLVQDEEEESGSSRASRSRSSPSPSPAKPRGAAPARGRSRSGGRGRGKGRGGRGKGKSRSPRGRKTKKKEEWDSEEEEEEYIEEDSPAEEEAAVDQEAGGDAEKMEDDDAYVPPKKPRGASRGRKSGTPEASPSSRKGRASSGRTPARRSTRGKKEDEEEEEGEAAGEGEEAEEGEAGTPGKPRRTRGTPKSSPPPRRSSRGATKAASEKLSLLAAQENEEIDDEEKEEETDGAKGEEAAETETKAPTKKRKIDEVEEEDVEEEAETKKAKVDEEEQKKEEEPDKAEKEDEVMDTEEKKTEKAKSDTSAAAEKPAEEITTESKKAAEPASELPCKQAPKESVAETAAKVKEDVVSAKKAKESKPSPTKSSQSQDSAPETVDSKQAEPTEPMETESAAAEEKTSKTPSRPAAAPAAAAVPAQDTPSSKTEGDAPEKSFVMVQKEDVPAADSVEVKEALPKHKAPEPQASEDKPVAETEKPSQPEVKPTDCTTTKPTEAAAPEKPPASSADSSGSQPADSKPCPNSQPQQCSQPDTVTVTNNHQPPTQGSQKSDPPTQSAPITNNSHGSQSVNDAGSDPLLHRQFCPNPALQGSSPDDSKKFTLVSYNVLANCHATHFATEYPFSGDNLSQDKRHQRLMTELRSLDADVVCLQEVGTAYYSNVLQPALKGLGYEGDFIKRNSDIFDEGEATFCRSSRFTVLQSRGLVLSNVAATVDLKMSGIAQEASVQSAIDSPAVAMITQLKSVATGDTLTVANIHVMFDHFQRQDLQCIQVACAIRQLVSTAGGADRPHVICGDFNSWPSTPIYQLTQEGYLNDQSMTVLQGLNKVTLPDGNKTSLVNMWWKGFQHTSSTLKSAYHTVFGKEPPTSRFPTDGEVRQVDFIWYSSGSLQLLGTLKTAPEDHIKAGIPNAIYPSDHVSLKASLAFQ